MPAENNEIQDFVQNLDTLSGDMPKEYRANLEQIDDVVVIGVRY